jgi:hypothetical protein
MDKMVRRIMFGSLLLSEAMSHCGHGASPIKPGSAPRQNADPRPEMAKTQIGNSNCRPSPLQPYSIEPFSVTMTGREAKITYRCFAQTLVVQTGNEARIGHPQSGLSASLAYIK